MVDDVKISVMKMTNVLNDNYYHKLDKTGSTDRDSVAVCTKTAFCLTFFSTRCMSQNMSVCLRYLLEGISLNRPGFLAHSVHTLCLKNDPRHAVTRAISQQC